MEEEDNMLIDALASQQMGVPPQMQQPQPQAPAAPAESKPTPQEQVTEAMAPATESTNAKADPFEFFEVDMGNGNKRAYTPDQLRGIATRYSDLNYRHQTEVAPNAKTLGFLNQLRAEAQESGEPIGDDELYNILETALTAYAKNPTLGNTGTEQTPSSPNRSDTPIQHQRSNANPQDINAQLAEWEQMNAINLPPAYKEAIANSGNMMQQIQALTDMVSNLTKTGAATAATAEGQLAEAKKTKSDAGMQQIMNNMQRIQNKFGFPDESEQDFMNFVQGRGFDVWELMDYQTAETLASDFKNNQAAPELERFREMATRRQAFTGNVTPSSGSNGSAPQQNIDPDQEFIGQVTDSVMKQRNMM